MPQDITQAEFNQLYATDPMLQQILSQVTPNTMQQLGQYMSSHGYSINLNQPLQMPPGASYTAANGTQQTNVNTPATWKNPYTAMMLAGAAGPIVGGIVGPMLAGTTAAGATPLIAGAASTGLKYATQGNGPTTQSQNRFTSSSMTSLNVSDPQSPGYNPQSPNYDGSLDSSSSMYSPTNFALASQSNTQNGPAGSTINGMVNGNLPPGSMITQNSDGSWTVTQTGQQKGQTFADLSSLFGAFSSGQKANQVTTGQFAQGYDKNAIAAQTARNQNEADALRKLQTTNYLLNGGNQGTPVTNLSMGGQNYPVTSAFTPPPISAAQKQAAGTLQDQLVQRLAPGGSYSPIPFSSYGTPSTAQQVGNYGALATGALGAYQNLTGKNLSTLLGGKPSTTTQMPTPGPAGGFSGTQGTPYDQSQFDAGYDPTQDPNLWTDPNAGMF